MNLELAYISLSVTMIVIIVLMGNYFIKKTVTDPKEQKKKLIILTGSLIIWHIYMSLLGFSGFLQDFSFPPRFVILMIVPAFIFTGIFLSRSKHKAWIKVIPTHWLAFYQSFRIVVESLFVWSVAKGILHPNVTIEGYNYDMFLGISAPIIGLLVWKNREKFSGLFKAWNYLGLVVLASVLFVFFTSIFVPQIYNEEIPFPIEFGAFPYVFVAGFLMPSAVFMHVLSLVHLKHKDKK